jgi:hypothetical protein
MEAQENLPIISAIPAQVRDRSVRPLWKCFCCDSGKVSNPYFRCFVLGENGKPFICQRPDCEEAEKYRTAYYLSDAQRQEYAKKHGGAMTQREYQAQWDMRLTISHCEQMHLWHKADWDKHASQRSKRLNYGQGFNESRSRTAISDLTQKLSMPNGKKP